MMTQGFGEKQSQVVSTHTSKKNLASRPLIWGAMRRGGDFSYQSLVPDEIVIQADEATQDWALFRTTLEDRFSPEQIATLENAFKQRGVSCGNRGKLMG